jgi:hypothetical protein
MLLFHPNLLAGYENNFSPLSREHGLVRFMVLVLLWNHYVHFSLYLSPLITPYDIIKTKLKLPNEHNLQFAASR